MAKSFLGNLGKVISKSLNYHRINGTKRTKPVINTSFSLAIWERRGNGYQATDLWKNRWVLDYRFHR